MARTVAELLDLFRVAGTLPHGAARIAAVEAVIREADALRHNTLAFEARMAATSSYQQGGAPDKAFATFWWCVAAHDREPLDGWAGLLLWHFKGIVTSLIEFPEVPLEQIHAVLDGMETRYRAGGHTPHAVHQYRCELADFVGDAAAAAEQYRLWCTTRRGELSDCVGCETAAKVEHLVGTGRAEEAVALATPLLADAFDCTVQPQGLLTALLPAYLHTGRLAEAADAHRRAYPSLREEHVSLSSVANHLRFCTLTGNHVRGLLLLEHHLGRLARPSSPHADLVFSTEAAALLHRIAETGQGDLAVRNCPTGDITVAALGAERATRALTLAARFDARNGTSHQSALVHAAFEAEPVVEHLPLWGVPDIPRPTPVAIDPALSAAELADIAEFAVRRHDDQVAAAAWQRFDEVCPEPSPELLARQLDERADLIADDDPAAARADWTRAVALFAEAGAKQRSLITASRLGLLDVTLTPSPEALDALRSRVDEVLAVAGPDEAVQALGRLSHGQRLMGRFADAIATLEHAAGIAAAGDVQAELALRLADALAAAGPHNLLTAIGHARDAVARFDALGAREGACQAQLLLGHMHMATGQLGAAATALREARASNDPQLRAQAWHQTGQVAAAQDRVEDSSAAFAWAVGEFAAAGDTVRETLARVDFADVCLRAGRPDDAVDALEPVASQAGYRARFLLARAYRDLGRYAQATEVFDEVVAAYAAAGNHAGVGEVQGHAAATLELQHRETEAAQRFQSAADAYAAAGMPWSEVEHRRRAALAWHRAHDFDRARQTLDAATATADHAAPDPNATWHRAVLGHDSAHILAENQRPDDALARVEPVVPLFQSIGATDETVAAQTLQARLLLRLNRHKEAAKLLRTALRQLPPPAEQHRVTLEALYEQSTVH